MNRDPVRLSALKAAIDHRENFGEFVDRLRSATNDYELNRAYDVIIVPENISDDDAKLLVSKLLIAAWELFTPLERARFQALGRSATISKLEALLPAT